MPPPFEPLVSSLKAIVNLRNARRCRYLLDRNDTRTFGTSRIRGDGSICDIEVEVSHATRSSPPARVAAELLADCRILNRPIHDVCVDAPINGPHLRGKIPES